MNNNSNTKDVKKQVVFYGYFLDFFKNEEQVFTIKITDSKDRSNTLIFSSDEFEEQLAFKVIEKGEFVRVDLRDNLIDKANKQKSNTTAAPQKPAQTTSSLTYTIETDEEGKTVFYLEDNGIKKISSPELIYALVVSEENLYAQAPEGRIAYKWQGTYYKNIHIDEMIREAFAWLQSNNPLIATNEKARRCVDTLFNKISYLPAIDMKRCIIPCLDAWLEVTADKIRVVEPSKNFGFTKCIPIKINQPVNTDYKPNIKQTGYFKHFLDTSLPNLNIRKAVQEYLAYSLTNPKFINFQMAQFWIGNGGNGKGVLLELMQCLHTTAKSIFFSDLDSPFGLEPLINSSLAIVDEGTGKSDINTEKLKSLVSGGVKIPINRKGKQIISVELETRWLMSTNHIPRLGEGGNAISRRFFYIPFNETPSKINNLSRLIFENNFDEFFGWIISSLSDVIKNQCIFNCKELDDFKEKGLETANNVARYAKEVNAKYDEKYETPKQEVYADYQEWCRSEGIGALRAEEFWKRMIDIFKTKLDGRRGSANGKRTQYVKVRIHCDDEPEPAPKHQAAITRWETKTRMLFDGQPRASKSKSYSPLFDALMCEWQGIALREIYNRKSLEEVTEKVDQILKLGGAELRDEEKNKRKAYINLLLQDIQFNTEEDLIK